MFSLHGWETWGLIDSWAWESSLVCDGHFFVCIDSGNAVDCLITLTVVVSSLSGPQALSLLVALLFPGWIAVRYDLGIGYL